MPPNSSLMLVFNWPLLVIVSDTQVYYIVSKFRYDDYSSDIRAPIFSFKAPIDFGHLKSDLESVVDLALL